MKDLKALCKKVRERLCFAREKYLPYERKSVKLLVSVSFIIYFCLAVWIIWFKMNDNEMILINFSWLSEMTILERLQYGLIPFTVPDETPVHIYQMLLNALLFAPLGGILCYYFEKENIFRDLLFCFLFSLFFELLQLFSAIGAFATTDLICNSAGYFLGLLVYRLLLKGRSYKFSVIFLLSINIATIPLLVYALIGTFESLPLIISLLTRSYNG